MPARIPVAATVRTLRAARDGTSLAPRRLLHLAVHGAEGTEPLILALGEPFPAPACVSAHAPPAPVQSDPSAAEIVHYALACIDDRRGQVGETLARMGDAALHRFAASSPDYLATGAPGAEMEILVHESHASVASIKVTSETDSTDLHFHPLEAATTTAQVRARHPRHAGEDVPTYSARLRRLNAQGQACLEGRPLTEAEVARIAHTALVPRRLTDDLQSIAGLIPRREHEPRKVYVRRVTEANLEGRLKIGDAPLSRAQVATLCGLGNYADMADPVCTPLPPHLAAVERRFPLLPHMTPEQQLREIIDWNAHGAVAEGAPPLTVDDMVRITGVWKNRVRQAMIDAVPVQPAAGFEAPAPGLNGTAAAGVADAAARRTASWATPAHAELTKLCQQTWMAPGERRIDYAERLRAKAAARTGTASSLVDIALVTRMPLIDLVRPEDIASLAPALGQALESSRLRHRETLTELRRRLFAASVEAGQPLDIVQLAALTAATVVQVRNDPLCQVLPDYLRSFDARHPRGQATRSAHARTLKRLNDEGLALLDDRRLTLAEISALTGLHVQHLTRMPEFGGARQHDRFSA